MISNADKRSSKGSGTTKKGGVKPKSVSESESGKSVVPKVVEKVQSKTKSAKSSETSKKPSTKSPATSKGTEPNGVKPKKESSSKVPVASTASKGAKIPAATPAKKPAPKKMSPAANPKGSTSTSTRKGDQKELAKPSGKIVDKKGSKPSAEKAAPKVEDKTSAKTSPPMKSSPQKSAVKVAKGPVSPPPRPTNPKVVKKIRELQSSKEMKKDLAQDIVVQEIGFHCTQDINHDPQKDRIVLVVRDSYWLQASWEITRRSVDRARAAMAEYWHTVKPVLRVLRIDNSGTTNNSETILRDIEIHGGVRNWYIDVIDPPSSFRVLVGYVAGPGRFHELVRSNIVTTPIPGSDEAISTHWADIANDAERIFALSGGYSDDRESKDLQEMFEDHLKRPMGAPPLAQFGNGAEGGIRRHRNFHFDLDAEMIVFGSTHPNAYVTLGGEPVKVQSDGTFSVRVPLPDKRQVLPATACTRDGVDEQTIVIAVERNTKVMEPLSKENEEQ